MTKIEDVKICLITDSRRGGGRPDEEVVAAAVRGGVRCVQYRPWRLGDGEFLATARRLRRITAEAGCLLIINDRVDIAALANADGVQVGAGDIPVAEARRLLGDGAVIGYSAHERGEALEVAGQGADFVTFSPVFQTDSGSLPRALLGVEAVEMLNVEVAVPLFALGGINEGNASELIDAGIEHIAVVSAITSAEDVESAARRLCELFGQKRAEGK